MLAVSPGFSFLCCTTQSYFQEAILSIKFGILMSILTIQEQKTQLEIRNKGILMG